MSNKDKDAANDLSKVIKEVQQGVKDSSPDKKVVIVDVNKRRAIDAILTMFAGRVKYFIVSNTNNPLNKATGVFPFSFKEDPPGRRSLDIAVSYAVSCHPGDERRFAASLCVDLNPTEAFKTLVFKWILDYINSSSGGAFIDAFSKIEGVLAATIKNKAREAGIHLEVGLSVPGADEFTINEAVNVRFSDFDQEETVRLKAELKIDQRHLFGTQTDGDLSRQELIKRAFREHFSAHVSLQSFYFDPGKLAVKQEITRRLSQVARTVGCTLSFLSFDRNGGPPLPRETFEIRHPVTYSHDRGSLPVTISTDIEMDIKDSARYRKEGSPELSKWVKEQLDIGVNRGLFGSTYLDLLDAFDPQRHKIVQYMTAAASRIGYSLRQLVTEPQFEAKDWLSYFDIKTEADEEQFRTNGSQFPVRLHIAVVARLKDLKSVAKYLNSGQKVPTEMKRQILAVTDRFLRTISPERFYIRFNQTNLAGEKPIVNVLRENITATLAHEFNAEIKDISLVMEQTDLVKLLNDLKSCREEFVVTVASLNTNQTYAVAFYGAFRVMDVTYDGWDSFSTSKPSIEQIRKCIVESVRTELQNDLGLKLAHQDSSELDQIATLIKGTAVAAVDRGFGLRITLENIRRQRTDLEERWIAGVKESNELLLRRFEQERQRLMNQFVDSLMSGAREEQLAEIKRQIADVDKHMEATRSSGRPSLAAAPEPKELGSGS
jgi:hypothetical protein